MAYVPPHLRNKQQPVSSSSQRPPAGGNERIRRERFERERAKQEEQEKQDKLKAVEKSREMTDDNFPALVKNATPRVCGGGGTVPYTTLAKNLQTIDDEEKAEEELTKQYKARTAHKVVLPTFYNTGYYPEEPLPEEVVVPKKKKKNIDADGFEIVDTKGDKAEKRKAREEAKQNQTFDDFKEEVESDDSPAEKGERSVWDKGSDDDDSWRH
jgi:hypothetical protein